MRFAHLKTHHRFERMRLRGLSGARDESYLAAIVQNLRDPRNRIWRPPLPHSADLNLPNRPTLSTASHQRTRVQSLALSFRFTL